MACTGDDARPQPSTTTTGDAEPAPTEWATAGADLSNSRAVIGGRLRRSAVGDLEERWTADLETLGALSTVPLVVDGVVYLQGSSGEVAALDASSGDAVWRSAPTGFNIGPFGVAVDDARVYALDGSSGVLALDSSHGRARCGRPTSPPPTRPASTSSRSIAGGLVIVSTVPVSIGGIYNGGDRGVVTALDAATGEVGWAFDTVLGDDLWGNPEVNSGGGAWYPPAVDLERGVVYVGVANPAPFPGTAEFPNGSSRPGETSTPTRSSPSTSRPASCDWYHQVTPHDIFDRDQVHTLIVTLDDGTTWWSAPGKSGVVVGLDPDDGTVRWRTEVGVHDNDDLDELDGPTVVTPGTYGGVLTPPATADGVVYLPVGRTPPTELTPDETAYFGAPMGIEDGEVVAVDAADRRGAVGDRRAR